MKVLVMTANGMFGNRAVKSLSERGVQVRAMVRDISKFSMTNPNIEVVTADLDKPESLEPIMQDISHIFLASPMHPQMAQREMNVINTARNHKVQHIVKIYGAVRHEGDFLDSLHLQVIEHLKQSHLKWALVSPNSVMETSLMPMAESIKTENSIYGMSGHGKVGLVALADVVKTVALVLTEEEYDGNNYEVTGPEALSLYDVAEKFSKVLGRKISYYDFSEDEFAKLIKEYSNMSDEKMEIQVLCHLRAWRNGKADLVTDTFQRLTNNRPTTLEQFIAAHIDFFQ